MQAVGGKHQSKNSIKELKISKLFDEQNQDNRRAIYADSYGGVGGSRMIIFVRGTMIFAQRTHLCATYSFLHANFNATYSFMHNIVIFTRQF